MPFCGPQWSGLGPLQLPLLPLPLTLHSSHFRLFSILTLRDCFCLRAFALAVSLWGLLFFYVVRPWFSFSSFRSWLKCQVLRVPLLCGPMIPRNSIIKFMTLELSYDRFSLPIYLFHQTGSFIRNISFKHLTIILMLVELGRAKSSRPTFYNKVPNCWPRAKCNPQICSVSLTWCFWRIWVHDQLLKIGTFHIKIHMLKLS